MLGLTKREITRRFDEIVEFAELAGLHRRAGEDVLLRHVHAPRVRRGDPRRSRRAARGRSAGRRRRGLHAQVPRQVRRVPPARQDDPARHALARPGRAVLRRGALDRRGRRRGRTAIRGAWSAPTSPTSKRPRKPRWPARTSARWNQAGTAPAPEVTVADPVDGRRGAGRHVPRDRRPMGIARDRDHRRHARRDGRPGRPRVPHRRCDDHPAGRVGRRADDRLRVRRRRSSTRTASAATAPTPGSRSWPRAASRARAKCGS